jgi:zinc transporter ZupT
MESSEPEYEDLDDMQDLIELFPEGEYFFVARTNDNNWATGTAELTHDIPAGPEIVEPLAIEESGNQTITESCFEAEG